MCKRYDHKTLQHKFMVCANREIFEKVPCGYFLLATMRVMYECLCATQLLMAA